MANLGKAFDSSQHKDMNDGFDPFPAGTYTAMIKESEMKVTKKKDGEFLKLKFEILEGEFKGRFVWTNLNLVNPNPVAVDIAQKELATICRACGKGIVEDSDVLHGIPFKMKVKIKPAKGDFPADNEPIGYSPLNKIDTSDMEVEGSESVEESSEEGIPWS